MLNARAVKKAFRVSHGEMNINNLAKTNKPALREMFNNYVDALHRMGMVSDKTMNNMENTFLPKKDR